MYIICFNFHFQKKWKLNNRQFESIVQCLTHPQIPCFCGDEKLETTTENLKDMMQGVILLVPCSTILSENIMSGKCITFFQFSLNFNPSNAFSTLFAIWDLDYCKVGLQLFCLLPLTVRKSVSKYKLVFLLKAKTTLRVQSTKPPTSVQCMIP